jgi:hypothetical protein
LDYAGARRASARRDATWSQRKYADKVDNMALTRDFEETILAQVQRDPKFRHAEGGIETLLAGDVDTAKRSCATTSRPPSKRVLDIRRRKLSAEGVQPPW